jgi:hypothetical protein
MSGPLLVDLARVLHDRLALKDRVKVVVYLLYYEGLSRILNEPEISLGYNLRDFSDS